MLSRWNKKCRTIGEMGIYCKTEERNRLCKKCGAKIDDDGK